MKKSVSLLIYLVLLAAVTATVCAQERQTGNTIRVESRLVEVYATVYDRSGRYVDGLNSENFQILEDGRAQQMFSFETSTRGISCVVLLDTTGSMTDALPRVKNSVIKLIDHLGPEDSIAIYTFDEQLTVRQDFTSDRLAAKRAVLRARAQGNTALFDALSEATQNLSKRSGKKALVVFTDGEDNSSVLSAIAASSLAKRVGVPLYAIAEGDAVHSKNLTALLTNLSERTGGSAYAVNKGADIDHVFEAISQDLQHLYLLTYEPDSTEAAEKWRKIDVIVKGVNEARIRAKEGYFPN
jgi:Ca-activated chloride channel homolog